jgi:nucleoside-diphosphate-sugar epimerase
MISNDTRHARQVLITGAGGFIGRWAVRKFAAAGYRVRALLGPGDSPEKLADHSYDLPEFFQLDVAGDESIDPIVAGCDAIVHLAGPASVSQSFAAPSDCARIHVCGTINVVARACALGVRRIVYISSAEVYGRPLLNPVAEDHQLEPLSPYGAAKAAAERFVEAMAPVLDIRTGAFAPVADRHNHRASPSRALGLPRRFAPRARLLLRRRPG